MRITILGGSGFLGTNISKALQQENISFNIFDIEKSKFFPEKTTVGSICSIEDLKKIPDSNILINLAAVHRDDVSPKSLYDEVNVNGSKKVCEYAKKNNIDHIIFTSSVAIYGFAEPDTGEDGAINYFNDYGRTKYLAEQEWDLKYRSDRGEPRYIVDYMKSNYQVPIMTNSESILQFGNNAYAKPATALVILRESILGRELFDLAFKEYANKWKFKRPTPYDFFRTMEEASGTDLDWF